MVNYVRDSLVILEGPSATQPGAACVLPIISSALEFLPCDRFIHLIVFSLNYPAAFKAIFLTFYLTRLIKMKDICTWLASSMIWDASGNSIYRISS